MEKAGIKERLKWHKSSDDCGFRGLRSLRLRRSHMEEGGHGVDARMGSGSVLLSGYRISVDCAPSDATPANRHGGYFKVARYMKGLNRSREQHGALY
jgi:hypothetical protein